MEKQKSIVMNPSTKFSEKVISRFRVIQDSLSEKAGRRVGVPDTIAFLLDYYEASV